MKIIMILTALGCIAYATAEPPRQKQPLVFTNWPPKSKHSPSRGIMIQIRNGGGGRPLMIKRPLQSQHRLMRPVKMAMAQQNYLKSSRPPLIFKRPAVSSVKHQNTQNVSKKPSYTFENPFSNILQSKPKISETSIRITHNTPMHTIPAPNLSNLAKPSGFSFDSYVPPQNNHLYDNFQFHQYQVTEDPTNDKTIRDPYSGQNKYYAPDPDPSLPTHRIKPALDPFSQPSNFKNSVQQDFQSYNTLQDTQSQTFPQQQQYVQIVTPIPQQQLQDSYNIPLATQPQLQQHFQQQQSLLDVPISAYNPTYLVTQSNQLFNQHQQHQQLFKPEASFLAAMNPTANINVGFQTNSVASTGQLYRAAQDPSPAPLDDNPEFAPLIGEPSISHASHSLQQPALTHQEYNNLLNFGNLNGAEQGFVASNYYQTINHGNSDLGALTQHQQANEYTLQQANLELQRQLYDQGLQDYQQQQQHVQDRQHQVAQEIEDEQLRIVVPDDYQDGVAQNFQQRSDNLENDISNETEDTLIDSTESTQEPHTESTEETQ